ncbi:MAG: ArsR family transcriptional regulator [Pirellulales bacterium]|nr:ArsR family transcriptional regulator [Pirellulales bacterium]
MGDLVQKLGVTATAVRHRTERAMEMGLVEREKISPGGRGRPTFCYRLTVMGHKLAGANPAELADAMWREIVAIEDGEVRDKLLASIAARLGRQYADQVAADDNQDSLEVRMKKFSEVLADRHIKMEVIHAGPLPVLDIEACPYPSLTEASDDRAMCRLEEQMISEALGRPVHLSSCRLDGDDCCQFSAVKVHEDSGDQAD